MCARILNYTAHWFTTFLDMMNYMILLFICIMHSTIGWQIPPAKFLLDLANIHNLKSISIYIPNNFDKWQMYQEQKESYKE